MNEAKQRLTAKCGRRRSAPDPKLCGMAAWTLLLMGWLGTAAAAGAAKDLVPVTMMAGFTRSAFVQSNRNDVESALRSLAVTIGRERGFLVTVTVRFFSDPASFHKAIEAGELNFAVFDSLTFVAEPRRGDFTPVFIPSNKGIPGRRYLLLVRRDRGLRTLDDLRGKSLVELQTPDLSVGHTWLLNLLQANGAGAQEEYFRSIEYVGKPGAAVLPVFFGKQDACIVDDLGFKLMEELNPQVGAQLQILEVSAPLVGTVMCASESNWSPPEFRPVLLKALGELHLNPAGQQLLALFKIDQLVPFQEARLDSARELWASYSRLHPEARP